ncbi:hypothetical protein [Enterococcus nangangensis]|uniref:hypothetical protein n=1 Tax=Enterococcus nangangensis TaxID=2559926 RepID=UPI0010F74668|nr:hypothetical protein [Enterococcus nangangensis]
MTIKFTATNGAQLPCRATKGSAGYDFYATEDATIPSAWGEFDNYRCAYADALNWDSVDKAKETFLKSTASTIIETNIAAEMPSNVYLQLCPRSGLSIKNTLIMPNSVGIIDSDYFPNTVKFAYVNLGANDVHIKKGERIGQGIFLNYLTVDDDTTTAERDGGFGSTGR